MGMPKGTKLSEETRRKMSIARAGSKNPNWKGGTIKSVVRFVKERDCFTCKTCGLEDKAIVVVDHKNPQYMRPDLAIHPANLQTLCPNCHARKTTQDRKDIARYKRVRNFIKKGKYQNSVCRRGILHDYIQFKQTPLGYLERCRKCGDKKHFPLEMPNHIYLSYHIRSALQPTDPLFFREYPTALKD